VRSFDARNRGIRFSYAPRHNRHNLSQVPQRECLINQELKLLKKLMENIRLQEIGSLARCSSLFRQGAGHVKWSLDENKVYVCPGFSGLGDEPGVVADQAQPMLKADEGIKPSLLRPDRGGDAGSNI
jgi:hypothetical protein